MKFHGHVLKKRPPSPGWCYSTANRRGSEGERSTEIHRPPLTLTVHRNRFWWDSPSTTLTNHPEKIDKILFKFYTNPPPKRLLPISFSAHLNPAATREALRSLQYFIDINTQGRWTKKKSDAFVLLRTSINCDKINPPGWGSERRPLAKDDDGSLWMPIRWESIKNLI